MFFSKRLHNPKPYRRVIKLNDSSCSAFKRSFGSRSMLKENLHLFRCPDDGFELLLAKGDHLKCSRCERAFRTFSDNLIELLPNKPFSFGGPIRKEYLATYAHLLETRFEFNSLARGWGDLSEAPKGYKAFVKKERSVIEECLGDTARGNFCDVSGGAGSYSLYFADIANLTVHCDLDVNSINNVYGKAKGHSKNMLFVRCDYLQMPFAANTFDSIICVDTLERGYAHEFRLLTEISRCLKPHGKFVVDFHNESRTSHLPFSMIKSEIASYDYVTLEKTFLSFSLDYYSIEPFGYVPMNLLPFEKLYPLLDGLLKLFLVPSARWIVAGEKK